MSQKSPPSPLQRFLSLVRRGPVPLVLRFVDQGWRKLTGAPLWSLSRVTEHVYIGGQHSPSGWEAMQEAGISAVLNLREAHFDDVARGIDGTRHMHLPTRDNTPLALDDLERAADFIADEVQRGGKVYVHCGIGVGRAPSAAAAYFIKYQGMSADEALDTIHAVRSFVHLTHHQRQQLWRYEEHIAAEKAGQL